MSDNNEPLLSVEETNALLDAMRSGGDSEAEVEGADLASPERPLRAALDRADGCSRSMAHAIDKLMIRMVGCSSTTEEQPSEIVPYKVIRGSIAQGSGVTTLSSQDGSLGLLVVSPALTAFLLDSRLGAPLAPDGGSGSRLELSPLDRRLLKPFVDALAETLGEAWCNDSEAFTAGEVCADTADVPMMGQFEPMLQLGLRVAANGLQSDQVWFALSVEAVRSSVPKTKILGPSINEADRKKMVECLRGSAIRCTSVLGRTKATVGHVLSLEAGDLLRLDGSPEAPVDLCVRDTVVLRGKPVLKDGNLALQVLEIPGR